MWTKKSLYVGVLLVTLTLLGSVLDTFAIEEAPKDTADGAGCTYLRPSIDTTHALAIYC